MPTAKAGVAELPFGARVAIEARLEREYERDGNVGRKVWKRRMLQSTQEGIMIGVRTLSNGDVHYWGEDGGIEYKAKEHFTAALVVTSPRSKPFLTMFDDIKERP
jgi:hypothetical protein